MAVDGQARHVGESRLDGGVTGDVPATGQCFSKDDIVNNLGREA